MKPLLKGKPGVELRPVVPMLSLWHTQIVSVTLMLWEHLQVAKGYSSLCLPADLPNVSWRAAYTAWIPDAKGMALISEWA